MRLVYFQCDLLHEFPRKVSEAVGGFVGNTPIVCGGIRMLADSDLDDCYIFKNKRWRLVEIKFFSQLPFSAVIQKNSILMS